MPHVMWGVACLSLPEASTVGDIVREFREALSFHCSTDKLLPRVDLYRLVPIADDAACHLAGEEQVLAHMPDSKFGCAEIEDMYKQRDDAELRYDRARESLIAMMESIEVGKASSFQSMGCCHNGLSMQDESVQILCQENRNLRQQIEQNKVLLQEQQEMVSMLRKSRTLRSEGSPLRHSRPEVAPIRRGGSPSRHSSPELAPVRREGSPLRNMSPEVAPVRREGSPLRHTSPEVPPVCRKDISPPPLEVTSYTSPAVPLSLRRETSPRREAVPLHHTSPEVFSKLHRDRSPPLESACNSPRERPTAAEGAPLDRTILRSAASADLEAHRPLGPPGADPLEGVFSSSGREGALMVAQPGARPLVPRISGLGGVGAAASRAAALGLQAPASAPAPGRGRGVAYPVQPNLAASARAVYRVPVSARRQVGCLAAAPCGQQTPCSGGSAAQLGTRAAGPQEPQRPGMAGGGSLVRLPLRSDPLRGGDAKRRL